MGGNGGTGGTDAVKQPNAQLGSWFMRSGWSKGELARQVNRRARLMGAHHISTDTSRVRRWLDGEQPREPIPRILSELFSERFGCVVGIEELGLRSAHQSPSVSGVDLPWAGAQTVGLISEFSRSDLMLARRGFLGTSLALAAGPSLIEPMQRWLVPVPASQAARRNRTVAAGPRGCPGRSWSCWSRRPRCSASGTRSAAADCGARRWSASCTRSPTSSRSRSRGRCPSGCSRSPPNSPNWRAG